MEKWSVITQQVVRSTACYSDTGHSNLTFTVLASKGLKSERSKKEQFVYVDNGGEQLFRNVSTVFLTLQIICSNRQIVWLVIIWRVIGLIFTWLVARILRNLVWLLRTIQQTPINIKNWCNKIIFSIKVKVYEEHSSRYKPCHLFYLCCPVASNNRGLLSISHDDHKYILTTSSIIIFKIFFWYHYVRSSTTIWYHNQTLTWQTAVLLAIRAQSVCNFPTQAEAILVQW